MKFALRFYVDLVYNPNPHSTSTWQRKLSCIVFTVVGLCVSVASTVAKVTKLCKQIRATWVVI